MHGPIRDIFLHRRYINIDQTVCVGCRLCADLCPLNEVLAIDNQSGKATVHNPYLCAGCMKCVSRCPSKAIRVSE